MDTGGSLACAEPCFGLIFGGGKAIDVCGQCANNLLRAVADNLKDNTTRRLLQAGLVAIAVILEFEVVSNSSQQVVGTLTTNIYGFASTRCV